jgi:hypothetical protein
VSPVKYKLDFYIPEDDILHSQRRENLKSYIIIICCDYYRGEKIKFAVVILVSQVTALLGRGRM